MPVRTLPYTARPRARSAWLPLQTPAWPAILPCRVLRHPPSRRSTGTSCRQVRRHRSVRSQFPGAMRAWWSEAPRGAGGSAARRLLRQATTLSSAATACARLATGMVGFLLWASTLACRPATPASVGTATARWASRLRATATRAARRTLKRSAAGPA
jgi:hypothetical protein